jgi:hypothetical protein
MVWMKGPCQLLSKMGNYSNSAHSDFTFELMFPVFYTGHHKDIQKQTQGSQAILYWATFFSVHSSHGVQYPNP